MRFTPLGVATLASALTLAGQQPYTDEPNHDDLGEFAADRPGFGVPTNVLPPGVVQLESGFGITTEADRTTLCRTLTWGSPLARVGVGHRTEIRFGGDGYLSSRTEGVDYWDRARGWSDFGLGAKIAVFEGHGIWPALSLIPTLSLPIGGDAFTTSAMDPSIVLAWSTNLPAKLSAGGTIGYASISDGAGRLAQRTLAASLGHSLVAGFSGYAEVYNVSPAAWDTSANWMLNGGVTHAVGRNAAIDAEVGRKFVSDKSCWFVSFGFAIRTTALRHLLGPPR
jgi:Putative MetA-pathway of phenol degradation